MVEPLRHRQTKGAATDMPGLLPPRHIPTLPIAAGADFEPANPPNSSQNSLSITASHKAFVTVCINQDFRELLLIQPHQWVTLPVRYDQKRATTPPFRLCPPQRLRPDARRSA